MNVIQTLSAWPTLRWPWLSLALSATFLEVAALYFQYGMGLEPCVMCIYQRAAIFALILSTLPAVINPNNTQLRILSFSSWLTFSFWGLKIAHEHVQMQNPDNFLLAMTCDVFPNFPSWFAIHQWLPSIFEARGTCDTIDWMFLNQSMPKWMVIIFATYFATGVIIIINRLIQTKSL